MIIALLGYRDIGRFGTGNRDIWRLGINMPTFEDLRIWQEAHRLMGDISGICKNLPRDERFRLKDQIERSASSVCDNIAEGYSAYYYNEKIKIMYIARREAAETQNHLRTMQAKGYINNKIAEEIVSDYQKVIKGINGYIKYVIEKRDAEKRSKT